MERRFSVNIIRHTRYRSLQTKLITLLLSGSNSDIILYQPRYFYIWKSLIYEYLKNKSFSNRSVLFTYQLFAILSLKNMNIKQQQFVHFTHMRNCHVVV